jgi:predicted transcriptional regulator
MKGRSILFLLLSSIAPGNIRAKTILFALNWRHLAIIAFISNYYHLMPMVPLEGQLSREARTIETSRHEISDSLLYTQKQRRRDQLDLLMELLEATGEPVKKTRLLYITAMNHEQVTRHLDFLVSHHMVEKISRPFEGYRITDNGRTLLTLFNVSEEDL